MFIKGHTGDHSLTRGRATKASLTQSVSEACVARPLVRE